MINFRKNDSAGINNLYKPPEEIQRDRESVYRRFTDMQNARVMNGVSLDTLWDKWEKQYEAWRPNKSPDDWQSNIVPPFTTTVVERALAEMVDQTIQPKATARGPEDVVKAKIINYVKDYTWEIGDGDLNLYAGLKQALVFGKTIWQEDYWQDKRQVKVLKRFNPETNKEEFVDREVMDFDDVYGENVNVREFFLDPMARTINMGRYKANDCVRRFIMNFDTFQENFIGSRYDQFGVAKLVKPGGDLNYYQYYQPSGATNKDNQVEVLFYWGRRPDKLIIVANDVVIRNGPNPYNHKQLPFAEGSDVPRLQGFWARGEPQLLESIQDELTTLRRMRIDRQHMDIFKMFLVSNRETLDDDEAIIAPSRFLYVDDPTNSIKALEYGSVNQTAYLEEDRLKQDGREVTGIESPQTSQTATEAAIFKESTMKALRLKIWLLSRELLTNIARLRIPNIVQYYSVPKVVNIMGEKRYAQYRQIRTNNIELSMTQGGELQEQRKRGDYFFIVSPEMITPQYGSYDLKLSGSPTFPVSKPLQQQRTAEYLQHPIIAAAVQSGYYDINKVADFYTETMDYDPDDLKAETEPQEQSPIDENTLYELANRENEIILSGKELPGTPNSTRGHTDIHLAFMSSQQFKDATNPQIIALFSKHIMEEDKAQQLRAKADPNQLMAQMPGGQQAGPQTTAEGVMASPAKAAMPDKMIGGEEAPASMLK
jgi:hypothetical protein